MSDSMWALEGPAQGCSWKLGGGEHWQGGHGTDAAAEVQRAARERGQLQVRRSRGDVEGEACQSRRKSI